MGAADVYRASVFEEEREMDPRVRALRTRISAALLAAATVAFWISLALPAVTKLHGGRSVSLEGWSCAVHYEPTFTTNGFLAVAFVLWSAAVWLRSRIAWIVGVAVGIGGATFHPLIGAWPGFEGIQRVYSGYWVWDGATAGMCAAFLVLPFPEGRDVRPRVRDDWDRFRARVAAMFAAGATVVLVWFHLFLPTSRGFEWREGPPQPDDILGWYSAGGTRSTTNPMTRVETRTRADGSRERVELRVVVLRASVVEAQILQGPSTAVVEFGLLVAPLLFLAASTTRRRWWRWGGAAVAAAVTAAAPFFDAPWPYSGIDPHPLVVVWVTTPALFLVAFLLLPPRRSPATAG